MNCNVLYPFRGRLPVVCNALKNLFLLPVKTEKISYLSPDWFSFDNHVLVGGGDKEVYTALARFRCIYRIVLIECQKPKLK